MSQNLSKILNLSAFNTSLRFSTVHKSWPMGKTHLSTQIPKASIGFKGYDWIN